MSTIGIRALKQNASAVVAKAAAGETVTITDRGRPVAQITPLPTNAYQAMIDGGLISAATMDFRDLPDPRPYDGPSATEILIQMREDERY